MHNQWVDISTMRVVLITIVVYVGLLLVFLGVRQYQLSITIHERIANAIMDHERAANAHMKSTIASRPIDHQLTLFSGVLIEQIRNTLPPFVHSEPDRAAPRYELIAMSPCNPRIDDCR